MSAAEAAPATASVSMSAAPVVSGTPVVTYPTMAPQIVYMQAPGPAMYAPAPVMYAAPQVVQYMPAATSVSLAAPTAEFSSEQIVAETYGSAAPVDVDATLIEGVPQMSEFVQGEEGAPVETMMQTMTYMEPMYSQNIVLASSTPSAEELQKIFPMGAPTLYPSGSFIATYASQATGEAVKEVATTGEEVGATDSAPASPSGKSLKQSKKSSRKGKACC